MEVTVNPPPPPPPSPTYDITGLTEAEVTLLRDLCGRFSCAPPRGDPPHVHSVLYQKLNAVLADREAGYRFWSTTGNPYDLVVRCEKRNGEGECSSGCS
jgi:hypothetical protein